MENNVCRLCNKTSELRQSHILPEFLYKKTYDEIHRALLITREKENYVQKGIREYLLCQQCETKLSKYEKYANEIINEFPNFSLDRSGKFAYFDGVDYFRFKLFQLSLIWRASISTHRAFTQVKLGPHEEKIRRMLNDENPGKTTDYGCLISMLLGTELLDKILQSPVKFKEKFRGHTAYKFVFGNITWVYIVSRHKADSVMKSLFLQESGLLRVMISSYDERSQLEKIAKNLHEFEQSR